MPHTKTALIFTLALALPHAAQALGLGEIHVDSALNERLAAEIDIVGATAEELSGITASIANGETFLRFGVERPSFLSSATFKIAADSKGRPVLAIRSKEPFTEPLINLLIDLHWHRGELVRQYTLLLDPPTYPSDATVADASTTHTAPRPAAGARAVAVPVPVSAPPGPEPVRQPQTIKVGAGTTLRGIASRMGSGGQAGLQRTMIAIFRANPRAFEGNINRLHSGAVLTIPSAAEISAISAVDAAFEVRSQMQNWRTPAGSVQPARPVVAAAAAPAALPGDGPATVASTDAALVRRVQTLEQELNDAKGEFERQTATLAELRSEAALSAKVPAVRVDPEVTKPTHAIGPWITAGLALAIGAIGAVYGWGRRRVPMAGAAASSTQAVTPAAPAGEIPKPPQDPQIVAQPLAAGGNAVVSAPPDERATLVATVLEGIDLDSATTVKTRVSDANADTTPLEAMRAANADTAKLKYKSPDLDSTEHHIQMPSILRENEGFIERRTSLVDVLRTAVEREPSRRDLRMKLLETFYVAAAFNRQGFLEVARHLAGERGNMINGEWDKITAMGRHIAADDELFARDRADDEALVSCA